MHFQLKYSFIGLLLIVLFANCEDVIDIDLESVAPQLVIEGQLTDVPGKHYVRITQTIPFDEPNNFPGISGALVTISDDTGLIDTLQERRPGSYETQRLTQGVYERRYTLKVLLDGQVYEAVSTMPQRVFFDSLTVSAINLRGELATTLIAEFTDPVGLNNNYHFVVFKNGQRQARTFTFDDKLSDGRRIARILPNPDLNLTSGDTCTVEMYCLDQNTFRYFFTVQQNSGNDTGGGVTPANPDNNFGNACLGYFSAHALQSRTIVVE